VVARLALLRQATVRVVEAVHAWRGGLTAPAPLVCSPDVAATGAPPLHVYFQHSMGVLGPGDANGRDESSHVKSCQIDETNYMRQVLHDVHALGQLSSRMSSLLQGAPTRLERRRLWRAKQTLDLEAFTERRYHQHMYAHVQAQEEQGRGAGGPEPVHAPTAETSADHSAAGEAVAVADKAAAAGEAAVAAAGEGAAAGEAAGEAVAAGEGSAQPTPPAGQVYDDLHVSMHTGGIRDDLRRPTLRWRPVRVSELRQVAGEGREAERTGLFRPVADEDSGLVHALLELRGDPGAL